MSTHDLRMFARAIPLVVVVILNIHISGQERDEISVPDPVEGDDVDIGCRETPAGSPAVSLEVEKAWIDNNALYADLLVTNDSEEAIRLPRSNVCRRYWHAQIVEPPEPVPSDGEYRLFNGCSGGIGPCDMFGGALENFVADEDIETIAPGRIASLRAVYLAQYVVDERKPAHQLREFHVTYMGWSRITVLVTAEKLGKPLEEVRARHCSLYGAALHSSSHFLTP